MNSQLVDDYGLFGLCHCLLCSFPDVMMPAYQHNPLSSMFFIVYISLQIFLFMKLVIFPHLISVVNV